LFLAAGEHLRGSSADAALHLKRSGASRALRRGQAMNRSKVEKISKALADKTRLKIFEAISARGRVCCGDLVSLRGVTPATVTHHLKILNEAGLIACRREGQFVYSCAVPAALAAYTKELGKIAGARRPKGGSTARQA